MASNEATVLFEVAKVSLTPFFSSSVAKLSDQVKKLEKIFVSTSKQFFTVGELSESVDVLKELKKEADLDLEVYILLESFFAGSPDGFDREHTPGILSLIKTRKAGMKEMSEKVNEVLEAMLRMPVRKI